MNKFTIFMKNLFFNPQECLHNNFLCVIILTFLLLLPRIILDVKTINQVNVFMLIVVISYCYFFNYIMLFVIDKFKYISRKLSVLIFNFVFLLSVALFIIDSFLIYKFNGILDQTKLSIIFSVDPYTVKEFLLAYVISDNLIIIPILLIIILILFIKLSKNFTFKIPQIKILNRWTKPCFVGSLIISLIIFKSSYDSPEKEYILKKVFCMSSLNRVTLDVYSCIKDMGIEKEIFEIMDKNTENIIENKSDIPYIIFILGESADRNKIHTYGYQLENSPNLDKRINNGEAIAFTDTIAPANHTTLAMEYIFTFYNKESKNKWFENQNFIDILKSSGYYVSFISNQSPINLFGNMDDLISKRASYKIFTEYSGGNSGELKKCLDGEILPILNDILQKNKQEKQFYILHFEGSHVVYSDRYPKEFDKFSAEHIGNENNLSDKAKTIRSQYANSILYTDYLIEEIIKKFENKDCFLVYFSDHGNEVFDGRDFFGHSDESLRSKNMIEIPFVVWGSNEFWNKRPQLKEQILNAKDKPYMTDDFIHFLLDVMKIKTNSYEPSRSVINKEYNENRIRIYGGEPYTKNE